LANFWNLETLIINWCDNLKSLDWIEYTNLKRLRATWTKIEDFTALKNCDNLEEISIYHKLFSNSTSKDPKYRDYTLNDKTYPKHLSTFLKHSSYVNPDE
jgi:hypothetical protein